MSSRKPGSEAAQVRTNTERHLASEAYVSIDFSVTKVLIILLDMFKCTIWMYSTYKLVTFHILVYKVLDIH